MAFPVLSQNNKTFSEKCSNAVYVVLHIPPAELKIPAIVPYSSLFITDICSL